MDAASRHDSGLKQRERQRPEAGADLKDHIARTYFGEGGDLPHAPLLDDEVLPSFLVGRTPSLPAMPRISPAASNRTPVAAITGPARDGLACHKARTPKSQAWPTAPYQPNVRAPVDCNWRQKSAMSRFFSAAR